MSNHYFYAHICFVLDPTSQVQSWRREQAIQAQAGRSSTAIPEFRLNYEHYQFIRSLACIACRMRRPLSLDGYNSPLKRSCYTLYCGRIYYAVTTRRTMSVDAASARRLRVKIRSNRSSAVRRTTNLSLTSSLRAPPVGKKPSTSGLRASLH